MRAKKYTIAFADLNAGAVQTDFRYTESGDGLYYYPTAIKYVNSTGADLGFLYLNDDKEKGIFNTSSDHFDYIPLAAGESSANLPTPRYLNILILSGTASADLVFYAYNYVSLVKL